MSLRDEIKEFWYNEILPLKYDPNAGNTCRQWFDAGPVTWRYDDVIDVLHDFIQKKINDNSQPCNNTQ